MSSRIDLAGKEFGKLTVLEYAYTKNCKAYWKCLCDCGKICIVPAGTLLNGTAKSCGCNRKEAMRKVATKHGLRDTRLYSIWCNMKDRCYNQNNPQYKWYGGKDTPIEICSEWLHDFKTFYDWAMTNGYKDDLTIDRINFNGNYSPDNCRFVTIQEQQNNKSNNHLLTYNGKTMNITQWAQELGLPRGVIKDRLRGGWSVEKALTTPPKQWAPATLTWNGETHNYAEWSRITGIPADTILKRAKKGMSPEEILTKPVGRGLYTVNGVTNTVAGFAKEYNIPEATVRFRLKQGMSLEEALTKPVDTRYSRG